MAPRRVQRWPGDVEEGLDGVESGGVCGDEVDEHVAVGGGVGGGGAVEGGGGGRSGENGERGRHESDGLERERERESSRKRWVSFY